MDYDLYHDESKEAGYWHGMLLVPRNTRGVFLTYLDKVRRNTKYQNVIRFKRLKKASGKRFRCARAWLSLAVAALIQDLKGERYPFYTGKDARHPGMDLLDRVIGARFILLKVRNGHTSLDGYPDDAAKIETTFRMGLKGGLHLFADESSELSVRSFHFDGCEHYGRRVDPARIVGRLGTLRDGVCVDEDAPFDDRTGDHRKSECQSYEDCQFLQLTDLFVSGFRTVLGVCTDQVQRDLAQPLEELSKRWQAGVARMRNSRWYRGFCISECYLHNGEWNFTDLSPSPPDNQLAFPWS